MSSPETIDFAVLLKEFEGGNPAGVDLRLDEAHDSLMRRIKTYREASSAAERNNLKDPEKFSLASCKWDQVQQLCIEALSQHTKDFEIAAWLCESLVRDKGFPGLRDAFRLTRELAEKFWERLYPLPEGEDIAPRIRLLGGVFTGALLLPVKRISITADGCSFLDLDRSNRLQSISDAAERDRYIASGAKTGSDVKTLAEFQQLVLQTSDDFYRNLVEDLQQCIDELDKLDDVLARNCGEDESGRERAPATSDTRKLLEERQKELKSLLGDRLAAPPAGEQQPESGAAANALSPTTAVSSMVAPNTKQEMTRDLAFRLLAELALFFRRVEPHSPVSHHIEQAVRWGKMTLPELLEELIADENSRQQVFTRVGIERPENPQ